MTSEEQIRGVLAVIRQSQAVSPKGLPFMVPVEKLELYPDHHAILAKLEHEYLAIKVKQRPNAQNLGEADLELAEEEFSTSQWRDYMSYSISADPEFDHIYDELVGTMAQASTLTNIALVVESYHKATGVLEIAPRHSVMIAGRGKATKSTGKKYFECHVMDKLFASPKKLKDGVDFREIFTVRSGTALAKTEIKKVLNARTAINKKVTEAEGLKKLIITQGERLYINQSYLLKD